MLLIFVGLLLLFCCCACYCVHSCRCGKLDEDEIAADDEARTSRPSEAVILAIHGPSACQAMRQLQKSGSSSGAKLGRQLSRGVSAVTSPSSRNQGGACSTTKPSANSSPAEQRGRQSTGVGVAVAPAAYASSMAS